MILPEHATCVLFQQEVAKLLELPPGAGDAQVRKALLGKDPDYLTWYDTRLQAIVESNSSVRDLERTPPSATASQSTPSSSQTLISAFTTPP